MAPHQLIKTSFQDIRQESAETLSSNNLAPFPYPNAPHKGYIFYDGLKKVFLELPIWKGA